MADLTIRARVITVALADGERLVGLAEGDEDEPYVLFAQPAGGGPVRLELNDPLFAAEDAVARAAAEPGGLTIEIAPAAAPALGYARRVAVRVAPGAEGWEAACAALAAMLGARWSGPTAPG